MVFAALGDETRLSLVSKLSKGKPQSISELARGSPLTRQAITKHLGVLEGACLVGSVRVGRESLFELRPEPLGRFNHTSSAFRAVGSRLGPVEVVR